MTRTGPDRPLDVFLHIPKTAGTSFNTLLSRAYGHSDTLHVPFDHLDDGTRALAALPSERQQALTLLRGHITHGIHGGIPRPVRYFTVLRDPASRIVSFLNHMAAEAAHNPTSDVPWLTSLRDWSDMETYIRQRPRQVDNYMVRALSGRDFAPGACDEAALEAAIATLHAMPAFGVYADINASVLALAEAFDWGVLPVLSRSKSGNPRRITLTDRDRAVLQDLNRYDQALYDTACALFRDRLAARPALRRRADLYRRLTPAVTWTETALRSLRHRSSNLRARRP
ncbi:sulfotransferase family protein [Loktanella sp. TSTF-M6]|uniref:Sulfotransferase family protein n=1 Tax=Loktanella gaetbuli TaxID=2881335 RepID=A0ABS8BYJ3_9RHOB|nr:sulfotransferase family 2 domain-containing protein [Loktanella gaetbuli]MCB5200654.1 sulfotransferase family protein [Loktanella gaetbuli]